MQATKPTSSRSQSLTSSICISSIAPLTMDLSIQQASSSSRVTREPAHRRANSAAKWLARLCSAAFRGLNQGPDRLVGVADPPPAYRLEPDPFTVIRYVRICPHQTLSFERLYEVANLPGIRGANYLDALVNLPNDHDIKIPNQERRLCTPKRIPNREIGSIYPPSSFVRFRYEHSAEQRPGFVLHAFCQITNPDEQKQDIRIRLERYKIWLCPHMRLDDPWFVNAIHRLLHPGDRYDDPIEEYKAKQSDNRKSCRHCASGFAVKKYTGNPELRPGEVRIVVLSRRYLGTGETLEDPDWLKQRVLPENEEQDEMPK